MSDFELEISIQQTRGIKTVTACLKYQGEDKQFTGLIEKYLSIYDRCLINLVITIFPGTTNIYSTTNDGEIIEYKVDAMINTFFNTTLEFYPMIIHPISQKLRGMGGKILCFVLQKIMESGFFEENKENRKNDYPVIGLKPFGQFPGKEISDLIKYYLNLGFRPITTQKIEDINYEEDIDMVGRLDEILKHCKEKGKISEDVFEIFKNVKINQ